MTDATIASQKPLPAQATPYVEPSEAAETAQIVAGVAIFSMLNTTAATVAMAVTQKVTLAGALALIAKGLGLAALGTAGSIAILYGLPLLILIGSLIALRCLPTRNKESPLQVEKQIRPAEDAVPPSYPLMPQFKCMLLEWLSAEELTIIQRYLVKYTPERQRSMMLALLKKQLKAKLFNNLLTNLQNDQRNPQEWDAKSQLPLIPLRSGIFRGMLHTKGLLASEADVLVKLLSSCPDEDHQALLHIIDDPKVSPAKLRRIIPAPCYKIHPPLPLQAAAPEPLSDPESDPPGDPRTIPAGVRTAILALDRAQQEDE